MSSYEYLDQAGLEELVSNINNKYATKASIPTAVSDLTNDLNFQTDAEVSTAITSAIAGVTQFDYEIVNELPAEGVKGVIYLVANTGSGTNVYDEYIWIVVGEGASAEGRFELFGTKELEVVEYVGDGTYVTVTDGTGAAAGKKVVGLSSATQTSLGLADTAVQSIASSGSTIDVTGIGTSKNLEVSSTIVSGAAAGATALQSVASSGSTVTITGEGTAKNLEVSSTIVSGAAAGATATQPGDFGSISNATIDALFA